MEVHVLLLTDMLLICKQSTKKASSSSGSGSAGGGLKIVRQPLVVDRVRIHELKEQSSLGLVYLNEYGAASAALVLSAPETKLAKVRFRHCRALLLLRKLRSPSDASVCTTACGQHS